MFYNFLKDDFDIEPQTNFTTSATSVWLQVHATTNWQDHK